MAFILHDRTGVIYHTSSLLDRPGLIHGFSTRLGGVSEGMFASMNLRFGGPERDGRDRVTENYRRFTAALGADPAGSFSAARFIRTQYGASPPATPARG